MIGEISNHVHQGGNIKEKLMTGIKLFASLGVLFLLAGCGRSPTATIEESCHRFAKAENADEAEANEVCSCMANNLAENLSKKQLKQIAAAFEAAESGEDLERALRKKGGKEIQVMDAAKSCLAG